MKINPAIAAMKYAVDALDSIAEQVTIPKGTMAHEQLREVVALADRAAKLRAELAELKELSSHPVAAKLYLSLKKRFSDIDHERVQAQEELAELRAQVPVYQIRLASGAAATAWVDCTEVDYHSARLLPEEYRTRELYARHVPPAAVPDDVAKDAMLIYEKALVKLATLGNEPLLGNSSGNVIAQDALAQAAAILAANKENKT